MTLQARKKKGKQTSRRQVQPLPDLSPPDMGALSDAEDDEPSFKTMLNILVDLSSSVAANEQCMENLAAQQEARSWCLSSSPADPITSRGTVRRGMMTDPWHACYETVPEIAEEVRAREASCLRGALAMYPQSMDDDIATGEDPFTPA